jgi:uncharacterized protein
MILPVLLSALLTAPVPAPQDTAQPEMTTYQVVLLKKGANEPPAPEAMKKMLDEHLANLADLNRRRVNLLYGPVLDGGDLVGFAVFAVPNAEEARKAFAADPFVKAGVMVAEVRPWMGPKDWFQAPANYDVMNPDSLEPLVLGFLVRGTAPAPDQAAGEAMQKGHLAYMESLHKQGKLPVAGPFLDDTPSRGIVIYRVKDVAEAKALAAEDPAVKAGRLVLEAHPWMTLKGILK